MSRAAPATGLARVERIGEAQSQQAEVPAVDLHHAKIDGMPGCDELCGCFEDAGAAQHLPGAVVVQDLGLQP